MPSALPVRFPQLRSRSARTDPRAMARKLPDLSRFNSEGGREWSARVGRRATSRKTMTQPQPSRPAPAAGPEPVSFIIRWGEMVGAAGPADVGPQDSDSIPVLDGCASRQACAIFRKGCGGKWWARLGLNQRPLRCQHSALPLSYAPDQLPALNPKTKLLTRRPEEAGYPAFGSAVQPPNRAQLINRTSFGRQAVTSPIRCTK